MIQLAKLMCFIWLPTRAYMSAFKHWLLSLHVSI